jgi:putative membrane protein
MQAGGWAPAPAVDRMIVIEKANLRTLLGYLGRPLAAMFAFDLAIVAAFVLGGWKWLGVPDIPLSIFGGVIGVIAGFRNASAYGRWWEARTVWGSIVNNSRSFAREVLSMVAPAPRGNAMEGEASEIKRGLVRRQIAYVHALRNSLRGTPPWKDLAIIIPEEELERLRGKNNLPLAIQQDIADMLASCYRSGWIDQVRWVSFDRTLSNLMDSQGACERIKNTPMPQMYDFFIRLFTAIYCILLPLGMVADLKWLTPFGSTLVAFIFLTLDQIGRDLERPFENLPHDISLTAISRTIEIDLKQMIGERELPEPVAPVNGVLW